MNPPRIADIHRHNGRQAQLSVCIYGFGRETQATSGSGQLFPACGGRIWFTTAVSSTHPSNSRAVPRATGTPGVAIRSHIADYDWPKIREALHRDGYARLPDLLAPAQCNDLIAMYPKRDRFRSFIDMGPRRYGEGTYRYFANPLPALVRSLRTALYARLAPVANQWNASLDREPDFPSRLAPFIERCHTAGQLRPTPLFLRYETGGFNCLHQDVYGDVAFPLQVACLLSPSGEDEQPSFSGGEFIVSEQRPRQQTRAEAITLRRGEGLIFANQFRPVEGSRGCYRAVVKHGVSTVRWGERLTLGIIFHDAQ